MSEHNSNLSCVKSHNTFYTINFQVQLQEETLEEDKARPVNMRVTKDPPPSFFNICQDLQLLA